MISRTITLMLITLTFGAAMADTVTLPYALPTPQEQAARKRQ